MIAHIDILKELGFFSKLDYHFATTIANLSGNGSPLVSGDADCLVLLGAATASYYTRLGHVCAPLGDLAGSRVSTREGEVPGGKDLYWPEKKSWIDVLKQSPLVGDGSRLSPLVLEGDRLYLFRYWQYENRLAIDLTSRGKPSTREPSPGRAEKLIDLLFPPSNRKIRAHRQAAANAVKNRLTIISGGPGTGKTTTVLRILIVVLGELFGKNDRAHQIMLMAPTGKAAARLSESIAGAKASLAGHSDPLLAEALKTIPSKATTIHKALLPRADNSTRFVHNRENPLSADIVVVDEASMIDVALMTKLFDAVKQEARILLLGDKNQLASVEAGSVLGDICDAWGPENQTGEYSRSVVQLEHSFRFDAHKGIGRLSEAIGRGDFPDIVAAFVEDQGKEIQLLECRGENSFRHKITQIALKHYRDYLAERDPLKCLEELDRFRILCAHKRGPRSVEHLNKLVENALMEQKLLNPSSDWYLGRPILVTRNDDQLGLRNGDLGIVLPREEGSSQLAAYFRGDDLERRVFSLSRLPQCETVFSMTVHKAQGSEYEEVLIVLPEHPSPVLTRELLYTAVTRARHRVTIIGQKNILEYAARCTVRRTSGLKRRLMQQQGTRLSQEDPALAGGPAEAGSQLSFKF